MRKAFAELLTTSAILDGELCLIDLMGGAHAFLQTGGEFPDGEALFDHCKQVAILERVIAELQGRVSLVLVLGAHLAPSPTTTKGAQTAGWAWRPPRVIRASIDRRNASARATLWSALISSNACVISSTVASESTAQCETSRARAPA